MTKQQERVIEQIKKNIPHFDFYNSENYEIKKFEVKEHEEFGYVAVYVVTGMKGDEGTLAEALGRKHRHGFIGKKGGITYVSDRGNVRRCTLFQFMNEKYYH